jgi:malate dehydrogenase (oxaloacetate-decarboxylating)(NADP+)
MKPVFDARKARSGQARDLRRRRGRARAARRPGGDRGGHRRPILIGRPQVVEARLERFGLSIRPGATSTRQSRGRSALPRLCRPIRFTGRPRGVTPEAARTMVRTNTTVIAALAVKRGDADAMICGLEGRFSASRQQPSLFASART